MQKVLITGAAGFIGFHTIKKFLINNYTIYGVDNLNNYYSQKLKKDRIEFLKKFSKKNKKNFFFFKKDITEINFLEKLFLKHKFKFVIHLAAQAGVRYSVTNPQPYVQSNLLGFVNILELSRRYKIKHLIYASSSSVYGLNNEINFKEIYSAAHPINLYAATKRSNELLAHSYSHLYNLKTTGLRFFTVYGPWGRPDMAYFSFLKNLFENKPIKIHNFGKHKRDFSNIDLIVDGIFKVFKDKKKQIRKKPLKLTPDRGEGPFHIYNLASGKPQPLMKFIKIIEKITGKKFKKTFVGMQAGDIKSTSADTSKFNSRFRLNKKTTLEKGLSEFVDWYKKYYKII